jgi:hypothetical protein
MVTRVWKWHRFLTSPHAPGYRSIADQSAGSDASLVRRLPRFRGRYRHSRRVMLNNAASGTPTKTPSMPYDVTSSAALSGPALVANP